MEQAKTAINSCGYVYHFYKKRRLFYKKKSGEIGRKSMFKG